MEGQKKLLVQRLEEHYVECGWSRKKEGDSGRWGCRGSKFSYIKEFGKLLKDSKTS